MPTPTDPRAPSASPPRAHAAVALVRAASPVDSVLLLRRRADVADPWSGHWCLPGGRRGPEDVDLLATALRELHEECGIVLGRAALAETLAVGKAGPPSRYVLVAPFAFRVPAELDVLLDVHEMAEARWLGVEELRDRRRHRVGPVPGQPADRLVPQFDLPGGPLWGFTYRLLCDWLGLG